MKNFSLILFFIFSLMVARATHERAGEITFRHIQGLTYEIKILTYTFAPSPADRPELEILWGDGTASILPRVERVDLSNDIRRNVYTGQHTYSGASTYVISLEDPNRNYGIINIPNSVNIPFYIETKLVINPFLGPNNSPVLLNPPLDNGCVGLPYIHNPGTYDPDGDSLSYRFIECKTSGGQFIPGFVYPNIADPNNPHGSFTINPYTGDIVWDSPTLQGEYNYAILIEEWRNGILISSVTRDMQIHIAPCDNEPPYFDPIPDTCVVAGSTLSFDVTAFDPDEEDVITLTATGGPIVMENSPAEFEQPVDSTGTVVSTFTWETNCFHVQKQPYQVYFKVTDNGTPVQLIALKTVNIKVNGPPPENLTATAIGNNIHLEWDQSDCSNVTSYKIYRRFGSYGFIPGYCETGVPAYTGFQLIAVQNGIENASFTDDNNGTGLIHGIQYCYMVTAIFPDGDESYASNEACASLKKDIPIITNISIESTGTADGEVYTAWSKPTELDTLTAPGPYKYLIYRSTGLVGAGLTLIDSADNLNDTLYFDGSLNTFDNPWSYRIDLYNDQPGNRFYIGSTQVASSVFLTLQPTDNALVLQWQENVPWDNTVYIIYRQNPVSQLFDSIGWSGIRTFTDTGLVNGTDYCYKIMSTGHYSTSGIIDPIYNFSQETCGTPIDNVPPCPPELQVQTHCDLVANELIWNNPNNVCADDVNKYYIYYTPTHSGDMYVLDSLPDARDTVYLHGPLSSIAGCYAVTAIDFNGNQSLLSNIICVSIDSCSLYSLPNVFTPNGDGYNDYLVPFPYTSVGSISLQIFNRWGMEVYTTTDPAINWDGVDKNTGQKCSDGVYFYVCDVYEISLEGLRKRTLQGVVHLLR